MTTAPTIQRSLSDLEGERLIRQVQLDAQNSREARYQLGQFATPPALAEDVIRFVQPLLPAVEPSRALRFLEPAMGTGAFVSAILKDIDGPVQGVGYEIAPAFADTARRLWAQFPIEVIEGDFTRASLPLSQDRFDLLVSNPPYVRHHHLERLEKDRLRVRSEQASGVRPSGYTGLYGHFLLQAHAWLHEGGIGVWLIPSEFMDVGYGRELKEYLSSRVTLLHLHRFDPKDEQFADALVSSAVVVLQNTPPPEDHQAVFTTGGTLHAPASTERIPLSRLVPTAKWSTFGKTTTAAPSTKQQMEAPVIRLGDLFEIRRGAATGENSFFVLTADRAAALDLPREFLRPVLPSPRHLKTSVVEADAAGEPVLPQKLYLLDCPLDPQKVEQGYPTLWAYLQEGIAGGVRDRYLCSSRTPWYRQEQRPAPPFLCTYMGRGRQEDANPFRFILNASMATATNVYLLLYPKPATKRAMDAEPELHRLIWHELNALGAELLKGEGRVYGGGLHKLEPRELANAPVPVLALLLHQAAGSEVQKRLFGMNP